MSRKKGLLNISANFEPQIASPFDSRTVVDTFSDLTNPSTFVSTDSNSYVYKGLVVSVVNDPGAGNGVYLLKGLPSTDESNWEKLSGSMPIDAPEYDAEAAYNIGDVVVYISPQAEFLLEGDPFKEEALYECISPADIGEDPESYPNKWRYLGKVGEVDGSTTIIQVPGLSEELENRVKYSDISRNLKVTSDKKVEVDISYITVNGYSPSEDVKPYSEEVKINNTIWKTKNETWDDGGPGIYLPRKALVFNRYDENYPEHETTPADINIYGKLYKLEAVLRLLEASPGYRLPTYQDIVDTYKGAFLRTSTAAPMLADQAAGNGFFTTQFNYAPPEHSSHNQFSPNPLHWDTEFGYSRQTDFYGGRDSWENYINQLASPQFTDLQLNIVSAGGINSSGGINPVGFHNGRFTWYRNSDLNQINYIIIRGMSKTSNDAQGYVRFSRGISGYFDLTKYSNGESIRNNAAVAVRLVKDI